MTSKGLGEMFEGDSADKCAEKFPLVSMGRRAEGLMCADPGARTPMGASGNYYFCFIPAIFLLRQSIVFVCGQNNSSLVTDTFCMVKSFHLFIGSFLYAVNCHTTSRGIGQQRGL